MCPFISATIHITCTNTNVTSFTCPIQLILSGNSSLFFLDIELTFTNPPGFIFDIIQYYLFRKQTNLIQLLIMIMLFSQAGRKIVKETILM